MTAVQPSLFPDERPDPLRCRACGTSIATAGMSLGDGLRYCPPCGNDILMTPAHPEQKSGGFFGRPLEDLPDISSWCPA